MAETIFGKIIQGEIPAAVVHEDELCMAFKDIQAQAPVHILVIPKKAIEKVGDATEEDQALLGHLMLTASKVAREQGVGDAFRLVVNHGEDAGQSVFHLHIHVIGGRPLSWPPG